MITSTIIAELKYIQRIHQNTQSLIYLIVAIMINGPYISKFVLFILDFVVQTTFGAALIHAANVIIEMPLIAGFIIE